MGSFLIIILILLGIYTFWRLSRKPKAKEPNAVEKAMRDHLRACPNGVFAALSSEDFARLVELARQQLWVRVEQKLQENYNTKLDKLKADKRRAASIFASVASGVQMVLHAAQARADANAACDEQVLEDAASIVAERIFHSC